MGARWALARRLFADSRARNISFAALFALLAYSNVVGYRTTYPTAADRLGFAHAFAGNASVRLFYGVPYDLLTLGGYSAWRTGGIVTIFAGLWGALAAVRALRAEEDSGRAEIVLAGVLRRRDAYLSGLAAVAAGALLLFLALLSGLLAAALPVGPSAYLALVAVAPALVFAGVGALASQIAPTRRIAIEISAAVLTLALIVRVVADTAHSLEWLRWATPLGWAEEARAFTGARPAALLPALLVSALLAWAAGAIARVRDVGTGLARAGESRSPRLFLLSTPIGQTLRFELGSFAGWALGVGFFALVVGLVSSSVSKIGISAQMERELHRFGNISITRPSGYIGFAFLFFVLAVSLYTCSQLAAARHEESESRLETVLSLPLSRSRWLWGRLALAVAGALVLALLAGLAAWAGAAAQGADVAVSQMLEAGLNCLPAAMLFGALAALAFAFAPRATAGIGYGLVAAAFVWELVGGLLGAPAWLLELSPFEHVGLVPAQPVRGGDAAVMAALAVAGAALATWGFRRRDLVAE